MKFRNLLLPAISVLLAGCATPMREAVKMEGKSDYAVTVLGDTHYDGPQYHLAPPLSENGKREQLRNLAQWKGKSQEVLTAAAAESKDTAPFVIQLGDLTQGDCENYDLHAAMFQGAFDTLHKFFPGKKILSLRGNQDGRWKGISTDAVDKHFVPLLQKELGGVQMYGTNYAVRYGKDLYIFYDFKRSQVDFIRKMIESNADARHIIFLTHLPMFACSVGNPGWIVPDYKELIPLLAKHNAVVLCAHTHFWGTFIYKCKEGTLSQLIVNSMGNNWFPGTAIKDRYNSYAEWKRNINKKYFAAPNYKWSIDNLKFFKDSDFIHYETKHSNPSGFVKLEVSDSKVIANIFTDTTGKPVKSFILKGNK